MGHHAVVGADGLAVDVPAAVQHLDRPGVDPASLELLAGLRRLGDRRRVGDEDPARAQHDLGVRHDLPRLGQVEHDPVERPVGGIDPFVAVAAADVVAGERVGAEEPADVGAGPVGEVLADLVADDVGAPAQHRHRQRARSDPALEHPHARPDVGEHADRRQVLGVDHLRAPRHLDHEVLERRAEHGVLGALRRAHDHPFGGADDVAVRHESGVAVELAAFLELDEVAAALDVEQQRPLADLERGAHARAPASPAPLARRVGGAMASICTSWPGSASRCRGPRRSCRRSA